MSRWKHLGVRNVDGLNRYSVDSCTHLRGKGINILNASSSHPTEMVLTVIFTINRK